MKQTRISWDTSVKHYIRNGLLDTIPISLQEKMHPSNIHRWKNEPEDKYIGCEVAEFIKQELALIKRINSSSRQRKLNEAYAKLSDTFHFIINETKGIKSKLNKHKELVINAIDYVKDIIPVDKALRLFNISRTTYQNYKTTVINLCNESYFLWCVKKYPQQLLKREIEIIKDYMNHDLYKHWSKASVFYRAVRDGKIHFCLTTWYKYCNLLGYTNRKYIKKSDTYDPIITTAPNQYWCSDVTQFKLPNGKKMYLHLLIDHFSTKALGYKILESVSGVAIKEILQEAFYQYKPNQEELTFLTDGGSEFVNHTVNEQINLSGVKHIVAQRDVKSSNSKIEAVFKVFKHQFIFPMNITCPSKLIEAIPLVIDDFNTIRPQRSLNGYTPNL